MNLQHKYIKGPVSFYLSVYKLVFFYAQEQKFDYEQDKIQATAKDNGTPPFNSRAIFIIRMVEQNDHAPKNVYSLL